MSSHKKKLSLIVGVISHLYTVPWRGPYHKQPWTTARPCKRGHLTCNHDSVEGSIS